MKTPRTLRVQLELTPTDGTIRGQLTVEDEERRDFYGWLELINLLDTAVNPRPAQPNANR